MKAIKLAQSSLFFFMNNEQTPSWGWEWVLALGSVPFPSYQPLEQATEEFLFVCEVQYFFGRIQGRSRLENNTERVEERDRKDVVLVLRAGW